MWIKQMNSLFGWWAPKPLKRGRAPVSEKTKFATTKQKTKPLRAGDMKLFCGAGQKKNIGLTNFFNIL